MNFLEGLNPQQQEAAAHVEGPLLILAGAGSGKTRVITHRIAHLVSAHGVPPWAILAVTFTNKAAKEMKDRVSRLLEPLGEREKPVISTFHSFSVRLLRRDGASLADHRPGFTRNFTIFDDDDQLSVIKQLYKRFGIDDKALQHRSALSRISHAKNHKQTPADLARAAQDPVSKHIAALYEHYEAALRANNALDFDDLLLESVRLLEKDTRVREAVNQRYSFVMIDEYQDTNRSQYDLIRLMTEQHRNLAVVGDEDQSIYGWRGADIRNILDFERDFRNARVIRLEQNYRSTRNILDCAGAVVAHNKARKGKKLWTEADAGAMVGIYQAYSGENEALYIADTIEKLLGADPNTHVAVLYRTNFQSRQIEEALRRYGRKYSIVGGISFYQRAEVKDLLAYLKVLVSPMDSISLLRVVNTPARGIGRTTMEQAEHYALENNLPLWTALERMVDPTPAQILPPPPRFPARAEAAVSAFVKLIRELRQALETQPLNEVLASVLDRTGYTKMLEQDRSPDGESRLGNLQELVNAAAEAVDRGETAADFLDHAALVSDADQVDERAPVSLLTVHNAKGLEFPNVFLAGMEEGLFPHVRSLDTEAQMEEERRLCYVAMTRAEKRLYISWARERRRFGGGEPDRCIPSRFLREIPTELVEDLRPASRYSAMPEVDLFSEQHEVRQTARRNLYTGKTYNSLENVNQFFADRGVSVRLPAAGTPAVPSSPPATAAKAKTATSPAASASVLPKLPAPRTSPPASGAMRPAAAAPAAAAAGKKAGKGVRPGATVRHPKYGRGTLVRSEGEGDDAKLTVSFPGHGLKKLVRKYAGITIEE